MLTGLCGEGVTLEPIRPREAKLVHHWLTAGPGLLAERPAGRPRPSRHTLGSVDGAQERLQVSGALHLYKRIKLLYFQTRILLICVAQNVGQHRLCVRQA